MKHTQIFVYGTLKSGLDNNRLLQAQGAKLVGPATTVGKWLVRDGGFPVVLDPGALDCTSIAARLRGEVYLVDRAVLKRLDRLESNGHMYQRREITVEADNGFRGRAWMYVGNLEFWSCFGASDFCKPKDGTIEWRPFSFADVRGDMI